MSDNDIHDEKVCSIFHHAIEIIGKKWTGAIIYCLCSGSKRFSELQDSIPEISSRLLTERLKELEDNNIIIREITKDRPIQVVYSLTEKGNNLEPILKSIHDWAITWNTSNQKAIV
jgi:DNA-binding HxlR family transcriptional regulator